MKGEIMIRWKKMLMKIVLACEMTAFGYIYFFGSNGIASLQNQKKVVVDLKKDILVLDGEIVQLEKEIYAWQTDDFYKEKVAREQLQMARKGDELFYIG
ncbi:MAG TPA: septum formation initiator family protein [Candidatus Babeliales bacterium]|jgi:cell division protein FtsB|nr:septum formation initiator family protein [Candidatus Babeliales bacterium]